MSTYGTGNKEFTAAIDQIAQMDDSQCRKDALAILAKSAYCGVTMQHVAALKDSVEIVEYTEIDLGIALRATQALIKEAEKDNTQSRGNSDSVFVFKVVGSEVDPGIRKLQEIKESGLGGSSEV